jgi:hypothetical protein
VRQCLAFYEAHHRELDAGIRAEEELAASLG